MDRINKFLGIPISILIIAVAATLLSSCNRASQDFRAIEPEWRAAADSVYNTHKLIISRKNFAFQCNKEMEASELYIAFLDNTVVRRLDSLEIALAGELMEAQILESTFRRILTATEKHDGVFERLRNKVDSDQSINGLGTFIDSTLQLNDSLRTLSAKYKLDITQNYVVTTNLYRAWKDQFETELRALGDSTYTKKIESKVNLEKADER
jgi:hypothetical protein